MYPSSRYFGLEVVPIWVLWGQSIYNLGTWTLRECELGLVSTYSVFDENIPIAVFHGFRKRLNGPFHICIYNCAKQNRAFEFRVYDSRSLKKCPLLTGRFNGALLAPCCRLPQGRVYLNCL